MASPAIYPLDIKLENTDTGTSKDHAHNLKIIITNKADTAFSFLLMSCSWNSCISFKPEIIYRDYEGCPKNIAQAISLKPNESYTLSGRFKISDSTLNNSLPVTVGFRVVLPGDEHWATTSDLIIKSMEHDLSRLAYDPKYSTKDYTWSEPVAIRF
ncbi:hypothetical protein [Ferruginibacter sp.]